MAKGNDVPNDDGIAIERELPCKLTDDELRMRGDAMADAELEVDKLKAERRAVNKKIFAATDARNKLAHVIDEELENRVVVCKWIGDFEHNAWNLIRQDTGEQVEQRTMTAADRQGSLPINPGELPQGDENGEVHSDELEEAAAELEEAADDAAKRQPKKRKQAAAAKGKGSTKANGKAKSKSRRVHA